MAPALQPFAPPGPLDIIMETPIPNPGSATAYWAVRRLAVRRLAVRRLAVRRLAVRRLAQTQAGSTQAGPDEYLCCTAYWACCALPASIELAIVLKLVCGPNIAVAMYTV